MGVETAALYITAATAAYTVYSSEQAADAQRQAARDAERLAHENADLIELEGERELQLAKQAAADVEAEGRARAAASGFAAGGTQSDVLDDIAKKHKDSLEWMKKATKSQADITRMGGTYARREGYANASYTRSQGILSAANQVTTAGNQNNWWT